MNVNIEKISKLVTPDTSGIIWITDDFLNDKSKGVYEFNYLTNGLLTRSIQSQKDSPSEVNFFISESFGSSFFLAHISQVKALTKDFLKKIYNQVEIAKPLLQKTDCIVYVYNKSTSTKTLSLLNELSKRYSNVNFVELEL